jgi:carbonic anhydrase
VRVAGNVINDDVLGSLEFSCAAAGSKAIVVVGHTSCGAVKGATQGVKLEHLTGLLDKIQPAIQHTPKSGDHYVDRVAVENVQQSIATIRAKSQTLSRLEKEGKIAIVGAMYHIDSGRVEFLQ